MDEKDFLTPEPGPEEEKIPAFGLPEDEIPPEVDAPIPGFDTFAEDDEPILGFDVPDDSISFTDSSESIVDAIMARVLSGETLPETPAQEEPLPPEPVPEAPRSEEDLILDEMIHDFLEEEAPQEAAPAQPASAPYTEPHAEGMTHPDDHPADMASLNMGTDAPLPEAEPFPAEAFREEPAEKKKMKKKTKKNAEEPAAAQSKTRQTRKGRPARKKGYGLLGIPHLMVTVVWLAIILAIGVSLGRMLWLCAADVLAFGRQDKSVTITIDADDTIEDITDMLYENGLIRYPGLFKLYASLTVDDGEISTGTFTLNTLYDYHALVNGMSSTSSYREVVEDVLIPEGYTCRQIFELLEEKGICTVAELEEYAANGEFRDFWFLEGVERGDKYCLEGFLFPDTYDFYKGSTPREAIGKMLLGFEARIDQETFITSLAALNERLSAMMKSNGCSDSYIAEHQLTLHDVLIVASMIEEETASLTESTTIASVIYNRLTQDQEYERYLGIDAAIIYVTGDSENIDTSIDSPYNTYTNAGLTPGPITNPGLDSINAALDPEDTSYYYYVLDPSTGRHDFSKTLEEHEQKVAKYREAE